MTSQVLIMLACLAGWVLVGRYAFRWMVRTAKRHK